MVLSLQGCMAVGKTTAVRYLQENAPYVNISYEINTDVVEEVKKRQLDKNKYEDYLEIQKLWLNKEVVRYNKAKEETPVIDLEKIMNWDYVKVHLQLCIQRKGNEDIVKRDFLDLEEYVRVDVGEGTFKVRPEHLEKFGVTESVLFHAAWDCTAPTIVVEDMAQVMAEMLGVSVEEIIAMQGDNPMIVATTKEKHLYIGHRLFRLYISV